MPQLKADVERFRASHGPDSVSVNFMPIVDLFEIKVGCDFRVLRFLADFVYLYYLVVSESRPLHYESDGQRLGR